MKASNHLRTLVSFAFLSLVSAGALAADDSFTGKWKLNPDKSQFTGLNFKFEDMGGGKYSFAFGDDVETLVPDGEDHLTKSGITWAFTQTGLTNGNGRENAMAVIAVQLTVSEDGQAFIPPRACDPTDRPLTRN